MRHPPPVGGARVMIARVPMSCAIGLAGEGGIKMEKSRQNIACFGMILGYFIMHFAGGAFGVYFSECRCRGREVKWDPRCIKDVWNTKVAKGPRNARKGRAMCRRLCPALYTWEPDKM